MQNHILKGLPASPGMSEGIVRVVERHGTPGDFPEDAILVTEMTEPSMVLIMNKAAGIITDTGGITSHAAIISRELGIPCVTATGNATKILKDGMKVKVDGNSGLIYET